ncbi:hypothetical protein [Paenibacillus sp. KN14-4R]|uniref:hypothetical protein n=1 Tax=Paenibacillus sp. KN14-4R TaxID=3445773 RepID=UPI003FA0CDC4
MWMVIGIIGLVEFLVCIAALLYAVNKGTGRAKLFGILAGVSYVVFMIGGYQVLQDQKMHSAEAAIVKQDIQEPKPDEQEVAQPSPSTPNPNPNQTEESNLTNWLAKWKEERSKLDLTQISNLADQDHSKGQVKGLSKQQGNQTMTSSVTPKAKPTPDTTPTPVTQDKPSVTPEVPSKEGSKEQESKPEQPSGNKPTSNQMTAAGGLGDTLAVFEDKYGANAGNKANANFKNGTLKATFLDNGRAISMDYAFAGTIDEAKGYVNSHIPSDAVIVKQKEAGNNTLIQYQSKLLSSVVSHSDFVVVFVKSNNKVNAISISLGSISKSAGE